MSYPTIYNLLVYSGVATTLLVMIHDRLKSVVIEKRIVYKDIGVTKISRRESGVVIRYAIRYLAYVWISSIVCLLVEPIVADLIDLLPVLVFLWFVCTVASILGAIGVIEWSYYV